MKKIHDRMNKGWLPAALLTLILSTAGCGGSGTNSGLVPSAGPTPTPVVTSPTPTPVVTAQGPYGYIGCSMTDNAITGYETLGGTRFWAPPSGLQYYDFGERTISAWAQNPANNTYWNTFQNALDANPTTQVIWWEVCYSAGDDTYANAQSVLGEIRRRIPGAVIYVSAQPSYTDHVCSISGPDGPALMEQVASDLVVNDGVLAGPVIGPLTLQTTNEGGCHGNELGDQLMGQQLVGFFGM